METTFSNISYILFFWQILVIISFILLIYSLIDLLKSTFKKNDKLIWLIVLILIPFIGSLLYLNIGRKQKNVL